MIATITLHQNLIDKTGKVFTARDFEPADRAALIDMYGSFEPKRAAQGLPPDGNARIARWLDSVLSRGHHIMVTVDDHLLGHVMLIPMDDGRTELANFLHQSIRNRGIGTLMNRMAIELAREAGCNRVWLSVEPGNRAAVKSYEKAGFRRLPGALWSPEIEMEVVLD